MKNKFSRWQPWRPFWISNRNYFSYFWAISHHNASYQVWSQLAFGFRWRSKNRFSRWLPWILKLHDFSYFLAHLSRRLKVRYCDHSPSVVVGGGGGVVIHPSTIFKQHLLLNHLLEFDQTSQEGSLVGPLSKLFKWFQSIAYLGHRS